MTTNLPPPTTHPLFAGIAIEEAFAVQRAKALADIAALTPDDLLTGNLARLRTNLLETYRMRALKPDWDARSAEARAAASGSGSGSGSTVVFVPCPDAVGLLDMTPTRRGGDHPSGFIGYAELVLVIAFGRADAKRELERQIALITDWVARINVDVAEFNRGLSTTIRTRLAWLARRARESADLALELGAPRRQDRRPRPDERRTSPASAANASHPAVSPTGCGSGRPRWPDDLIVTHYEDAVAATPEPRTLEAIAAHFRPLSGHEIGVSPDQLRRLRKRIQTRLE